VTALSAAICYLTAPNPMLVKTAEDLGVSLDDDRIEPRKPARPGDFLEFSPILTILIVVLALGWLWQTFQAGNPLITLSGLNTYNFVFLILGILLHWRPRSLLEAFSKAMPSVSGVLLQFPFYAGIAQMLTKVPNGNGVTLSDTIAHWFVDASANSTVFSFLVGIYSAVLGFFIPSAGGKWVIEAPYIMKAANEIGAHLGWTVMVYNIAETLPNFINPFWMLPLLGILGLKSKDLIGYTSVQFFVHFPIIMILAAILMTTFTYHAPIHP
jgi:short-chain fatty acids transporter